MMRHIYNFSFVTLSCLLLSFSSNAQMRVSNDTVDSLTFHVDPRIHLLTELKGPDKAHQPSLPSGTIRTGKGFRVLIYSGADRIKANQTKVDFMTRYPGTRIYMTYSLPQYKVKVGDFANRQDAYMLYSELSEIYSPCMVVPDIVEINTFRK